MSERMRRFALVLPLLAAAALLGGCEDAERPAIEQLLDDRVRALGSRDLALYGALIAEDYADGGQTRAELIRRMAGYFERFDAIRLEVSDRRIEHDGRTARVSQAIRLQVSGLAEPLADREVLTLRKTAGRWLIVGGL